MSGKSKFILTGSASSKAVGDATKKGSRVSTFKMKSDKARVLILGPTSREEAVFGISLGYACFNGKSEFVAGCASKTAFGGKDRIAEIGWRLRKRFENDPSDKKKNLFKQYLPKKAYCLNVLDLDNLSAGPQRWENVPISIMEIIFEEIKELGDDLTSLCDLDKGRPLLIKTNGKQGLEKRYRAQFKDIGVNLNLSDEEVDKIFENTKPSSTYQTPYDEKAESEVYEYLMTRLEKLGISLDSDEELDTDYEPKRTVNKRNTSGNEQPVKKKLSDFDEDDLEEEIIDTDDDME